MQINHHQSDLVGDVAAPVSVRQVVLFCALRCPDKPCNLIFNYFNLPEILQTIARVAFDKERRYILPIFF